MIAPDGAGYGFTPLPKDVRRIARPQAAFDRRAPGTWSGEIEIELIAEQPVHVGAGAKSVEGGAVVRKAAVVQHRPGLPGSTLKGVLRSRFEAITKSCVPHRVTANARVLSQSHPDIRRAKLTGDLLRSPEVRSVFSDACRPREPMCPACALFGCMGVRGRVTVCDFVAADPTLFAVAEMPSQFGPRLHHVGRAHPSSDDRGEKIFEVTALHGRKFARGRGPVVQKAGFQRVEVLPKGSKVRGVLRVWCLTATELGGLLAALGRAPQSALKVGAGKGNGFGRMRITGLSPRLTRSDGAGGGEAEWSKAFQGSEDRFAAGEEALIEIHKGDA